MSRKIPCSKTAVKRREHMLGKSWCAKLPSQKVHILFIITDVITQFYKCSLTWYENKTLDM